jgi:hypothetical protein
MLVLDNLRYMDFNPSYIPVYFFTAVVFFAYAAIIPEDVNHVSTPYKLDSFLKIVE